MKVVVVEPGMAPYEKEIDGLKDMQAIVGGLITAIYPFEEKVALVSNDEAVVNGMAFNRSVEGGYGGICGPFFVCGVRGENFCSLTPEQADFFKKKYHHAEILLGFRGSEPVTLKAEPRRPPGQEPPKRPPKTPGR